MWLCLTELLTICFKFTNAVGCPLYNSIAIRVLASARTKVAAPPFYIDARKCLRSIGFEVVYLVELAEYNTTLDCCRPW